MGATCTIFNAFGMARTHDLPLPKRTLLPLGYRGRYKHLHVEQIILSLKKYEKSRPLLWQSYFKIQMMGRSYCKVTRKLRKKKLGVMEMNDNACTNLDHKVYRLFISIRLLSLWFIPMKTLLYILLRFPALPP